MNPTLKRTLLWLGGIVLAAAIFAVAAVVWWGTHPLGPSEAALAALTSDASVKVTQADDGWEFAPAAGTEPTAAVVYYPGGHVDARSYAPYARDIAAQGYLVVIPVMPLSLAVLSPDAADKVVAAHPGVSRWVIGGHSLGGAMAGQYVGKHPGAMDGLVLLGAYVPEGNDLSRAGIQALTQVGNAGHRRQPGEPRGGAGASSPGRAVRRAGGRQPRAVRRLRPAAGRRSQPHDERSRAAPACGRGDGRGASRERNRRPRKRRAPHPPIRAQPPRTAYCPHDIRYFGFESRHTRCRS